MQTPSDTEHRLSQAIEAREDELVALTQDLIRIPTLNPPGDCYLEICEYLKTRLGKSGFDCELVRAEGSPGDSKSIHAGTSSPAKKALTRANAFISIVTLTLWNLGPAGPLIPSVES